MSLFSNEPRKKKGFDWEAAAVGFFGGPDAARMLQARKAAEVEREREEQERFGRTMKEINVRSGLEQQGLPDHVIDSIMLDPKRSSEFLLERYKIR